MFSEKSVPSFAGSNINCRDLDNSGLEKVLRAHGVNERSIWQLNRLCSLLSKDYKEEMLNLFVKAGQSDLLEKDLTINNEETRTSRADCLGGASHDRIRELESEISVDYHIKPKLSFFMAAQLYICQQVVAGIPKRDPGYLVDFNRNTIDGFLPLYYDDPSGITAFNFVKDEIYNCLSQSFETLTDYFQFCLVIIIKKIF